VRASTDVCGCFPTGRHYPGIADRIARGIVAVAGLAREFEPTLAWAKAKFAVVDFETTGLDPEQDRVLEMGVVCFDRGEVVERRNWLVDPGIPVPEEARKVHGITDQDLATAPRFDEVFTEVVGLLAGRLPVAYNAVFDQKFLLAETRRVGRVIEDVPPAMRDDVVWIDPLVWVREILKYEEGSKKLAVVCERLGVPIQQAHRATDDAEAAGRVLLKLAPDMPQTYSELIRIQTQYEAHQDAELAAWRIRRN
jgi:DNA polymerase-3 subunit epsilon